MASRFTGGCHNDQYRDKYYGEITSRGTSLLRAPVRHDDFKTYLDYQSGYLEDNVHDDNLFRDRTNYENKQNTANHLHSEAEIRFRNAEHPNTTGNYIKTHHDNIFNRSFSQPDERSDEFINERAELERSLALNRSFSQPQRREDVNRAIHEELMNNPWGTYRRTPKRRDRYAIYIPDTSRNEMQHQSHVSTRMPGCRNLEPLDIHEYTENVYATYQRAPRTFPRLDIAVDRCDQAARDTQNHGGATRDTRRDGLVLSNLSKIPNYTIHSVNNSLMTRNKIHETLDKTDSVQHLFSVQLKDVKQVNKSKNEPVDNSIKNNNGVLKKINNNLSGDNSFDGTLKRKQRNNRTDMVANEGHNDGEKPFFYCRWVAEFPKTFFCKFKCMSKFFL